MHDRNQTSYSEQKCTKDVLKVATFATAKLLMLISLHAACIAESASH